MIINGDRNRADRIDSLLLGFSKNGEDEKKKGKRNRREDFLGRIYATKREIRCGIHTVENRPAVSNPLCVSEVARLHHN